RDYKVTGVQTCALPIWREAVRDEPRLRHAQAEPHHRAVRGVLLHRLERERVVQQVDLVHQGDLLQPLAREVVPPREAVDDEGVRSEERRVGKESGTRRW